MTVLTNSTRPSQFGCGGHTRRRHLAIAREGFRRGNGLVRRLNTPDGGFDSLLPHYAEMPSGLTIAYCGSHGTRHFTELARQATKIIDLRYLINA